jgi:predicted DNA-binding protein YlxM (UPF0122 family)
MKMDKIVKTDRHDFELVVLNDEQIDKLEEVAAYLNMEQIADLFGVCKGTMYNIMQRQPEVLERYKKGKSNRINYFADLLKKKASGENVAGDTTAMIFFLKTRARWSEALPTENIEEKQETPEERTAREEEIREFLEWKKSKAEGKA